ncbi:MAG: SRPBCC domain-containing protein [bacterium]|nr:SRPBCC domain-containing protein [bacterium]
MDRRIDLETTVNASADDVWKLWTTSEGMKAFLVEEAHIDLEPGGPYEVYFDKTAPEGSRGSEGCRILSYLPNEMLSFSWNAPPTIPALRQLGPCTWVVVRFISQGDKKTQVKITHLGIMEGSEWDKYLEYFTNAWPMVLKACKKHFAVE